MSPNNHLVSSSEASAEAALDKILEAAVDEFESAEQDASAAEMTGNSCRSLREEELERLDKVTDLLKDEPHFEDTVATTLKALSGNVEGVKTMEDLLASHKERVLRATPEDDDGEELNRTLAQTMGLLATESHDMEGLETKQVETYGEEMMTNVIAEFEKFGQKQDFNQVVENVLRQLLARDLMYEPVKLVCDAYPEWLAMHRDFLEEAEYLKYGTQYQYFQRVVAVYEREPDNFPRLMELFQDLQAYGQPPAEIITQLAPGLRFSEDGMPIPDVDVNVLPKPGAEPGMPSIPMPDSDAAQCPVM